MFALYALGRVVGQCHQATETPDSYAWPLREVSALQVIATGRDGINYNSHSSF